MSNAPSKSNSTSVRIILPASSAKRRVFAREPPRDQLVLKKQKHSNPITLFLKDRLIRQIKVLWQSSKQTANKLYKVLSIKFYLRSKAKVLVMCGVRVIYLRRLISSALHLHTYNGVYNVFTIF